jgi:WD40 repeat protein/tetratricopeptide (TPR) repeat protein
VSEGEKFTRWCRRNPTPASLLAALVLVFWLGFGLVAWNWREAVIEREAKEKQVVKALEAEAEASAASDRARGEEKKALEAAEVAGRRLYSSLIDRARLEHQAANIAEAEAVLDRCEPARRSWEWHFLKGLNNAQIFTLRGHEGRVEQAVFSPDGEWIATAGGGNPWFESPGEKVVPATVVLWDAKSGRPVHTLRSHTHQISQVVFIGNGSLLASGGHRGDIHIHEVATGRLLRTIATGHSIRTLATSSVGRRLATEAGDAVISWDIDTGAGSALLPKIPNGYFPIAYSPDGRWLASLMGTSAVRLWDAGTMTEAAWPEHPTGYIAVAISPDSRFLAGGSVNGLVSVWNLGDGKLRQTLSGHQGWVWALDFSADGRYLASVGQDRTVRVWDAESGSLVRVIRGHTDTVTDVAFSPDGDRLVTASHDGTARVWDLTLNPETGAPEFLQLPVIMPIDAISYARGGSEQRTFTRTGRVFRYAVGSLCRLGEISTGIDVSLRTPFEPASFDSGGDSVVAVDHRSGREAIWHELNGGGRRTTLRGHTLEIQFATLSADGTRAATAASAAPPESPGEVFVWDAAAGTVLHRREVNGEKIHRISLDPTGKLLAVSAEWNAPTGDRRGSLPAPFVSVIEVDTGREVLHRETRGDRCQALGFSGDGRRLAAAGGDRAVLIWDLGAGTAALESRQGPPSAMDLAFSPDGLRLAVASRQQVKLMDTATAEEVLTLRGRAQIVSNSHGFNPRVRFSPDGHELIAICDDSADLLAIWSSSRDTPANQQKRDSAARRRAVTRHLALADTLDWRHPPDRRTALYHLGFAERIGLESPEEFLAKGVIQSTHGSWAAAEAALNRAIALAPRDNQTLTAAALIASRYGRFDRAALWYDRIPNVTALLSSAELDEQAAGFFIRDDLARYQQFCAESVKRFDSDQTSPWNASVMAYNLSLGADPGLEAVEPLRIAQQVYQHMANSTADNRARSWALTALGAAHVRAGFPERAEPFFREAEKIILEQELGPILATWMAITTWQQGRRDEARAWLAKTDRFVSERVKNAPTELEGRPPEGFNPGHWWRIRIAQREAQHLILDSEFPADPFAR